jgi:hypothetical protein
MPELLKKQAQRTAPKRKTEGPHLRKPSWQLARAGGGFSVQEVQAVVAVDKQSTQAMERSTSI